MATNITISTGDTTTVVTVPEVQNNVTVSKNEITSAEREKISNMVTLDEAQTISGAKTFTANTTLSGPITVITGSVLSTGSVTIANQSLHISGSDGELSVDGSSRFFGSATYDNDLIASSLKFIGNGTSIVTPVDLGGLTPDDLEIRSNGNVVVKLDYDDNESGQKFKVTDNNAAVKFSVDEDGSVAVSGSLSVGDYTGSPVTDTGYLLPSTKGSATHALLMDANGHALGFRGISFSDINVSNTPPPAGSPPPGQFFAKYLLNSDGSEAVNVNHGGSNLSINSASMPNSVGLYVNGDARINGAIQVGDAFGVTYAFPTTDGSANQLLATDGSGAVTFVTPSTSNVTEGTNLYYTDARVAANSAVAANTAKVGYTDAAVDTRIAAASISDLSDVPTIGTAGQVLVVNAGATALEYANQTGGVTSVNTETGAVVLDTDDIDEGATNLYFTDAKADARIAAASIDDLSDVDTSTVAPTDGQALVWDNANSKWEPGTVSGGGGSSPWTTSGSDIYYTTGNVGVGTTTPGEALDVSGKANINDGSNNVLISTGNSTITATNTVAVGYQALTALTTGAGNTAVGYQASDAMTVSAYTTALGYQALSSVNATDNSADGSTAVGYQALTALTTGASNTAVGYQAGLAITAGNSHTIIGREAGKNITTASTSVIIGGGAGAGVTDTNRNNNVLIGVGANTISNHCVNVGHDTYTTGQYSIALGFGAGKQSSSGTNSTYIGFSAGRGVNGANNTTVGHRNMYFTSGAGNAVLGASTLDGGGSGNNDNVIVGAGAGHSGTGNVLIGRNAGSTGTLNNKLYIENSNSATPLIYGEFDNDIVRVNGTLQVNDPSSTGYAFPTATGTTGQVLEVDANGDLVFATPSGGGGGGGLGSADQTLTADRTIDTNGFNLDIELDPTGTADTFTIHDGTHDLFQVDTGTTGTIFSVNDVSGLPKLTVDDSEGVTIDKFKEVKYEKPSNTDFSYQGDVVYFGATTGMTQGDLYYFNSSGNWAQADADAVSSSGSVLLAIALGTASDTNGMLLKGTFTMAAGAIDGTEATGDELYVSTTAGHVTSDVSAYTTGDVVRVIGYCLDGTNGQIWFNPSNDWIELS